MSFDFITHRFREHTFSLGRQILADVPSLPDVGGAINLADRVGRVLDALEAAHPQSDLSQVFSQFHNSCQKKCLQCRSSDPRPRSESANSEYCSF